MPEDRRHAAIMFTDIVGYTALMGRDEDAAFDMLARNHTLHEALIEKHNGILIKEVGDGTLASFPLASNAVRCAMEIQNEAKDQNIPLKIGIHEGEMVFTGGDVLGDGVNIASRLQENAQEGCINISAAVYTNIRNKADIRTKLIGERSYKNVGEPIKVYKVLLEEENENQGKESQNKKKSKRSLNFYFLVGLIVVIAAFLTIWNFTPFNKKIEFEKSIVVRPFWNESANQENEFFVNGITEEIRNNLAKIADLRVLSRGSVEKYKGSNYTNKEIADEQEVSYVLEGTVQRIGDQVMIHTQLILPETEDHLWEETYREDISDISKVFDIQSQIAQSVAKEIHVVITPEEKQIIESIPTTDLTAYDFFLRAREEHTKFWMDGDKKALDDATTLYYRALEYDSTFAQAYTGLGFSYINKLSYGVFFSEENILDSVLILSNKALSFNENLEEAYYLRSTYLVFIKNEYDSAIFDLNKAIQINPNYAPAYLAKGIFYVVKSKDYLLAISNFHKALGAGDYLFGKQSAFSLISSAYLDIGFNEKSVFYAKEGLKLSNDSSGYLAFLASIQYNKGDFEESSRLFKLSYELDTTRYGYIVGLLHCYFYLKKYEEAFNYAQILINSIASEGGLALNFSHRIAYAYWMVDKKDEAKKYFDQQIHYCLESIRLERPYSQNFRAEYYDLAAVYAFLGEKDKAYQYLEEYDKNAIYNWGMVILSKRDPLFDSIRHEEKFQTIIQNMDAKFQKEHNRVNAWLEEEGML